VQIMVDFCTLYNYDRQQLYDRYVELMKKMQDYFKMDQYDVCTNLFIFSHSCSCFSLKKQLQ